MNHAFIAARDVEIMSELGGMRQEMLELQQKWAQTNETVQRIWQKLASMPNAAPAEPVAVSSCFEEFGELPVRSLDGLRELEAQLQDGAKQKKMVRIVITRAVSRMPTVCNAQFDSKESLGLFECPRL